MKSEMDAHNAWLMQGVNEINALMRGGRKDDGSIRQFIIDDILAGFAKRFSVPNQPTLGVDDPWLKNE